MALSCNCPLDGTLPDVLIPQCLSGFGQVNKVIFQRLFDDAGAQNYIPIAIAGSLDSWDVFFAAVDSTRMVITPYVYNPTFTAGAKRTFGGGNATPGGRVEVIGAEVTTFTSTINNMAQPEVIKPLKSLMCESALGVYLINETGKIAGIRDGDMLKPFPIDNNTLFIGDWAPGGFENPDTNALEWSFKANWSDDLTILTPEFDPLSALFNTGNPNPPDPTQCVITFAPGGSGVTGLPTQAVVNMGANYTIPATAPTRSGDYEFTGYLASGGKTGTFQPGATLTNITQNVLLTAQWQALVVEDPTIGYVQQADGSKTIEFTATSAGWITSGIWRPPSGDYANDPAFGPFYAEYRKNTARKVRVPQGVTQLLPNEGAFDFGCWGYDGIFEGVSSVNRPACTLILPAGLTEIGRDCLLGINEGMVLICNATTPPTLNAQHGMATEAGYRPSAIRVPAASVNAYKAATNWSAFSAEIVAI